MNIKAKNFFSLPQRAIDLIERFEGFSKTIYACPANHPTVGFGHVIQPNDFFGNFKGIFLKRTFDTLKLSLNNRNELNKTLAKMFPNLVTRKEAVSLLRQDLMPIIKIIRRQVSIPLTKNQISSLISLIYNIGIDAFKRSTLLKKLNRKDFKGVSHEFSRWVFASGKPLSGLKNRRKLEKEIFITP